MPYLNYKRWLLRSIATERPQTPRQSFCMGFNYEARNASGYKFKISATSFVFGDPILEIEVA